VADQPDETKQEAPAPAQPEAKPAARGKAADKAAAPQPVEAKPIESPHLHVLKDGRQVALGKKPPKPGLPLLRLEKLAADNTIRLPTPGPTWDISHLRSDWGMFLNDKIGCCTAAAIAHMREVQSAQDGKEVIPTDDDVLKLYEAVTALENNGQGYDPSTGANDNGCVETDVLNYLRRNQFYGDSIFAFASVSPSNHNLVQVGAYLFGGLYIGIDLPLSAEQQLERGQPWDWVGGHLGRPGSWGGHAVNVVEYDPSGLTVVTWGALQRMTWQFWDHYVDESYVIVPQSWEATPPHWLNVQKIAADIQQLGKVNPLR
jgi:hypothetical protein